MEPEIRYVRTSDGVNIAYYAIGRGPPLVYMPDQISHIQLEWQWLEFRAWYERLAEHRTIVRYDGRGSGLSDRDAVDYSLRALELDLEAVVESLQVGRFALLARYDLGPAAISYAASHADRVSHLILWNTYARGADAYRSSKAQAWVALRDKDWKTYTETVAHTVFGWSEGQHARRFAAFIREATTPEAVQAFTAPLADFDVLSLLPEVRSPTLVVRQHVVWPDLSVVRELAAGIPRARLALLEGAAPFGDIEAASQLIDEFLREHAASEAAPDLPSGTAIILFTDIADSTALTERMGDAAFREASRALDERCRAAIREAGGTPVEGKVLGDGVMAVFTSARQAIDAALRCHAAADGTATGAAEAARLRLHIGVHAGDVIRDGNNVYGGAVNVAARIAGASAAGETLVSATVRDLARTSAGVVFEDRGEHTLKGIGDAQRLYAVRAREA